MRTSILLVTAVMLLMIGGSGCKKQSLDKTTVTIVNRLDVPVTMDLYASEDDYASSSNIIERYEIEAGKQLKIGAEIFENADVYHMDWYSADYYYNNWYNDDYPVNGSRVRISPEPGDNTYYLEPGYKGKARNSFIGGNELQSSWIAIGAFLYTDVNGYTNEWSTIADHERFRRIIVKKGFSAEYQRRDKDGNTITEMLPFMVHQSEDAFIEFKTADGVAAGQMLGGKLPVGTTPPDYASNATDTVMALFPDNEYLFLMVKQ